MHEPGRANQLSNERRDSTTRCGIPKASWPPITLFSPCFNFCVPSIIHCGWCTRAQGAHAFALRVMRAAGRGCAEVHTHTSIIVKLSDTVRRRMHAPRPARTASPATPVRTARTMQIATPRPHPGVQSRSSSINTTIEPVRALQP